MIENHRVHNNYKILLNHMQALKLNELQKKEV